MKKKAFVLLAIIMVLTLGCFIASAGKQRVMAAGNETASSSQTGEQEEAGDNATGLKAVAAGLAVGLGAAAGAIGMGIAVAKSNEAIARQPEAASKINSTMMLGLVFIETAIIYALIVAILIIFVL